MSMEDGTLRKLELYLHDLHKKIDGIYDMLMLRHERETEQKGSSAINEKLLDNQDLCLLFQISPRSSTLSQSGSASLQAFGAENLLHGRGCDAVCRE
jgi:hypothetical protein